MADPNGDSGAEEPTQRVRPISFKFDAAARPVVMKMLAREENRRKKLFSRKPKTSLNKIAIALDDGVSTAGFEKLLTGFHAFYYNHVAADDYYESLGRLLLQAASAEEESGELQRYLLFQALENLSISVQKAPNALNVTAQQVIVTIYKLLGRDHSEARATEHQIHRYMVSMTTIKKDPNDFTAREVLIKLYLRGHRYYDALVQSDQYERILKATNKSLYQQKIGEIHYRRGAAVQSIIDFYYGVQMGKMEARAQVRDKAKLRTFITRFNRDHRRLHIAVLKDDSILSLQKTVSGLIGVANHYYDIAGKSVRFRTRHRAYFFMARNFQLLENSRSALEYVGKARQALETARMVPKQKAEDKVKLLALLLKLQTERGDNQAAQQTQQILAAARVEAETTQNITLADVEKAMATRPRG